MKILALAFLMLSTTTQAFFYSNGQRTIPEKGDILVLMDNSGSMIKHKDKALEIVLPLIKALPYNDMNLGLITNGPHQPSEIIFKTSPVEGTIDDILAGLKQDINNFSFNGPATEEFYSAILRTTEEVYKGFYRSEADVVIYIITDEDEERVKGMMNTFDFIREFKTRLDVSKVKLNLITTSKKCKNFGPAIDEMVLFEAVRALGGNVYDLCPQDQTPTDPQQ